MKIIKKKKKREDNNITPQESPFGTNKAEKAVKCVHAHTTSESLFEISCKKKKNQNGKMIFSMRQKKEEKEEKEEKKVRKRGVDVENE